MERIELKDFIDFTYLSQLTVNNNHLAYMTKKAIYDDNKYETTLYYHHQPIHFTHSIMSYEVYGDTLYITYKNDEDDFVLYDYTHSKEIYKTFKGIASFKVVDANTFYVVINEDTRMDKHTKEEWKAYLDSEKDYEVFNQIPYYSNNNGYTSFKYKTLYKLSNGNLEPVTASDTTVEGYKVKGDCVYYSAHKLSSKPSMSSSVVMYDGTNHTLVEQGEYRISSIILCNDDVYFTGKLTHASNLNDNSKFYKVTNSGVELFYDYPLSIGSSVGSDARLGGGQGMKVVDDVIYFITTTEYESKIYSLDLNKECKEVVSVEGSVDCFDIVDGTIYMIAMVKQALQEVYAYKDGTLTKLTSFNNQEGKYVAKPELVEFSNDGIDFKGWVLLPYDYDPSKSYPAIFDIHGGPKTVYGTVYYHEMQVWASLGYFVYFTNPRGSDGRGDDFANIYGKYGTIDYDDLMKFSDVVLEKYPAIDKTRVGVTGGSYGGYMTNWIVGHTDRFKAACTQRSISNWISFYGTSDIGFYFALDQIHGNITDKMDKLWWHSPLKYIDEVKTPLLFIHSDEDYRCPLEQGLQFYTALVDKGVESKFVMFKGENHELSRGGKIQHRVRRLEEITSWFETHLK